MIQINHNSNNKCHFNNNSNYNNNKVSFRINNNFNNKTTL